MSVSAAKDARNDSELNSTLIPGPGLQELFGETRNGTMRPEVRREVFVQDRELLVGERGDPLTVIEAVPMPRVRVHLEHDDRHERVAVLAVLEHQIAPRALRKDRRQIDPRRTAARRPAGRD